MPGCRLLGRQRVDDDAEYVQHVTERMREKAATVQNQVFSVEPIDFTKTAPVATFSTREPTGSPLEAKAPTTPKSDRR